jgi:hypothetical protein
MKKSHYTILLAICFIVILIVILTRKAEKDNGTQGQLSFSTNNIVKNSAKTIVVQTNKLVVNQTPANLMSPTERATWSREMFQKDPNFEYKAPISFFGHIVDESNNPIEGVAIALSCVDASEATGETTHNVVSDNNGLFSLEGAHGRSLVVASLVKRGYTESVVQNKFLFNYGYFPAPDHFSPNPNNPVIFVMRKNREGEPLIVRPRAEAKLETSGQSKLFPIGNGDVFVSVERLSNEAANLRFWHAHVTMPDGGLQLTTEEFPYEAPEDGYTNEFVITNGLSVQGEQGGMFYIKTSKGYGRMAVYYVPNVPWAYVESWFNPNPNSRNLEVDPSKVQIIKP